MTDVKTKDLMYCFLQVLPIVNSWTCYSQVRSMLQTQITTNLCVVRGKKTAAEDCTISLTYISELHVILIMRLSVICLTFSI